MNPRYQNGYWLSRASLRQSPKNGEFGSPDRRFDVGAVVGEDEYKAIGARLRAAREALGLPQEAVADEVGVTIQAYSRYENGERKIPIPELMVACRFLGVRASDVLGESRSAPRQRSPDEIARELLVSLEQQRQIESVINLDDPALAISFSELSEDLDPEQRATLEDLVRRAIERKRLRGAAS